MRTKLGVVLMLVMMLSGSALLAKDAEWLTDFEQAKKLAAKNEVPILLNFSGSDWCTWCIRLSDEVLSKDEFKTYAETNLVLLLADFPRSKKLPEDVAQQNEVLARQYGIRGFPTVLLMDAEGNILAQTGYRRGGASAYVSHVKKLIEEAQKDQKDQKDKD